MRGLVLQSLAPGSLPASYAKTRASDKQSQDVNMPAMPVVWTRQHVNEAGRTNRIVTSTLGSATDFENEGLRRLFVNAVYWGLDLAAPAQVNVDYVDLVLAVVLRLRRFSQGLASVGFRPRTRRARNPAPTAQVDAVLSAPGSRFQTRVVSRRPPSRVRAPPNRARRSKSGSRKTTRTWKRL